MTLGKRIHKLRVQKRMSQELLAEHLEVSRQAVSKWENDVNSPDTQKLIKLAELFNVSVDYLATGQELPTDNAQSSQHISIALKRISCYFFIVALLAHCIGFFTGEFTDHLIPVFPYLWYGKSVWAIVLNAFTVLFTIGWISLLVAALSLDKKKHGK